MRTRVLAARNTSMFPLPPGWTVASRGDALVLRSPGGAVLAYRERQPLASLEQMVGRALEDDTGFTVGAVSPAVRLVTAEGEDAVLVTVSGVSDGRPAARTVGLVLLDDHHACLVGGDAEVVRTLILADQHRLGHRPRRFRYQPPAGWRSAPAAGATAWLPPERGAAIIVWPTFPLSDASPEGIDALVDAITLAPDFALERREGPCPVVTRSGLDGELWDLLGRPIGGPLQQRTLVVLADDRYAYAARLETLAPAPAMRELFLALVDSIEPIPRPQRHEAIGHWTE